jgi:type I restriction enzyme S subunit
VARISEAEAEGLGHVTVEAGDVLINITGESIARSAVAPSSILPARVSQHVAIIRPTSDLDSRYLQRVLVAPAFKAHLVTISQGGATRKALTKAQLADLAVPVPPLVEQRAIAKVLGALDDKIAANATLVSTAERLAKAVVATRSPSVALSEVARQVKKTFAPTGFGPDPVSLFSLPAFDVDAMPEQTLPTDIKSAKILIDEPLVLISKLNPRFPRVWDVPVLPERRALASTEFVALASPHASSSVLWAILSQPSVSESLQSKVAGTSGSHQRVRPAALLDTPVVDPREMSEATRNRITSLGKVIQERRIESQTLTTTRDALLPLLMSGKIRVKDAERAVDEVL